LVTLVLTSTFVAGVFNNTTKREGKTKDKMPSVTMVMMHFKT